MASQRKPQPRKPLAHAAAAFPFDGQTWARVIAALKLAPQQARITELIILGMSDKQIANKLGIRVPTVRTYLSRVFDRLNVDDRVQLVVRVFAEAYAMNGCESCRRST